MEFVRQWVTQIIIFLLLAVIIDLLIPKTSMKKYVKLVIGLILMLIFLKPVFLLFSIDFQSDLSSSFKEIYESDSNDQMIESFTKNQKIDIQASQAAYILEEMTTQLKNVAEETLQTDYQVEIAQIEFEFLNDEVISFESLEEIIVYLRKVDNQTGEIQPIDEVVIGKKQTAEDKEDVQGVQDEEIKLYLQSIWEVTDKQITINWEGGTF